VELPDVCLKLLTPAALEDQTGHHRQTSCHSLVYNIGAFRHVPGTSRVIPARAARKLPADVAEPALMGTPSGPTRAARYWDGFWSRRPLR
jgi:hypothetical protein